MKLLTQNQVFAQKSSERKAELDEGLKIAKRVDEVRLTLQKEQMALEKFRGETTKIVQAEINALLAKKDELTRENMIIERQNLNLKRPFDEEWELIKMTRLNELDEKLYDVERREKDLAKKEFDLGFLEKDIKDAEARIMDQDKRSESALKSATEKEQEAHEILNQAKIRDANIQSEIDAKTKAFKENEDKWKAWQMDLEVREEALKRSIQALVKRERFVNDKYRTLLRTEEAIKSKK